MRTIGEYFSKNYWKYGFSYTKVIKDLLSVLGVLWLLVEITSYFSEHLAKSIKEYWYIFFAIGALITIWKNRPILSVKYKLNGRDIIIEVRISDIFSIDGAQIIGANTTFDTDLASGLISEKSLQGQLTKRYYGNVNHLDGDLDEALKFETYNELEDGSKIGKLREYEIGTVANITVRNRNVYFVAVAKLNAHGRSYSSFDNIKECLVKIWDYIANRGAMESLVIPVLGTGLARVEVEREVMIKEIIMSFIAACSTKRFTEKLTIVIHPSDYKKFDINIFEIGEFLSYQCKYVQFKNTSDVGEGTAIPTEDARGHVFG